MPIFRASYIQQTSNPDLIAVPGKNTNAAKNNINVMENINFDPQQIATISEFSYLEVKAGLAGLTSNTHAQYGTCIVQYTGKSMKIVQITKYEYDRLKDAWINNLPNYPNEDPIIVQYI